MARVRVTFIGVSVRYEYIDDQQQLSDYCDAISESSTVAFDTEFISEDSYQPHLCLLQIAAADQLAIVDPLAVEDLTCFWQLLARPGRETVVHAGREEFRFCLAAIGQRPSGWFDLQLAAGFVGLEYPAAYGTLISKLLGKSLPKGETRTDWRQRPLSRRQLEYALQDVKYLEPLRDALAERLERLGRRSWFDEDSNHWQQQLEQDEQRERWQRVSGISGLSIRSLAVVRELWRWRDAQAQRRNCPAKRVLRDDLVVELARRKSADRRRIGAVRGMERYKRHLPEIAGRIQKAMELPEDECPRPLRRSANNPSQYGLIGQFLNTALGSLCRSAQLAPTLVGTVQDVRDLVAYQLEGAQFEDLPALARGWRAEVVGRVMEDLLAGKLTMRIANPRADQPLTIEPEGGQDAAGSSELE